MSEFSHSWHLRESHDSAAIALLVRAKVNGFVFPASGGWVPFVAPREDDRRVSAANVGLLVRYVYASDHGADIDLFEGPKRRTQLSWQFEVARKKRGKLDLFVSLGLLAQRAAQRLGPDAGEHDVASALGLSSIDWFSHAYELTRSQARPDRKTVDWRSGGVVASKPADRKARDQVMCALSKKQRALIEGGNVALVVELHDFIDDLDNGVELWMRWHLLGCLLAMQSGASDASAAVCGELGTPIAAPADARVLSPTEVASVARQLGLVPRPISAPGLAELSVHARDQLITDLAAVTELFTKAAANKAAVLVSFYPAHALDR